MPVYKFRSFEEAEQALWHFHPAEEYYNKLPRLWEFAGQLYPVKYPHGIIKLSSMKEANEHRQAMEDSARNRTLP